MSNNEKIQLGHGSGGDMMTRLINDIFFDIYGNDYLKTGDDAAVLDLINADSSKKIAFSTDSFVVSPQFFPGGDLGHLAVCGSVNDVATSGAVPRILSLAFILEEGYPIDNLKKICKSIARTADEANVQIVTGDTKVVEAGSADGMYINTSCIGTFDHDIRLSGANCSPGDAVIVSGTLGDHGMAIMSCREGLNFQSNIKSDAAPLISLICDALNAANDIKAFRDPTRGGLASTLNEFAAQSNVDIVINQSRIPVKDSVSGVCDMLGFDVLQVANEGKIVCVCPWDKKDVVLSAMHSNKYGKDAAIIGKVEKTDPIRSPKVFVETPYKTRRILDMLAGEQLPRIC